MGRSIDPIIQNRNQKEDNKMTYTEHYAFNITVKSYTHVADKFKKKNNLTWDQVEERLRKHLQVDSWSDAYDAMQEAIDWENSDDGKKFIAEQEAKERM